jgi:hypothetical protein
MNKLLVAKNLQAPPRPATKEETCQHWMVGTNASSGGRRFTRCAFGCGKSGSRPMKPGESIFD